MLINKTKSYLQLQKLNVDNITNQIIGEFGRWQLKMAILMSLLKLPMAWYQLNIIFMAPPQEFWCAKPNSFEKYSDDEWRKICTPQTMEFPCLIFDPDILIIAPEIDKRFIPLVPCKSFVYDQTMFTRTVVSDYNFVCSKRWYIHMTQCLMMTGMVIGGIVFGAAADKYGRKKPLLLSISIQALGSYFVSIAPWVWVLLLSLFILALGCGGISIISFVFCMEVVSGKWRTYVPVLYQLPFGFGNIVLSFLAYWLRDWRKLEFSLATISTAYLAYWFLIPESPRWLLATGRTEKAIKILKNIAKENNMQVNDISDIIALLPNKKEGENLNIKFIDFVKSKNMRRKTLLLSIDWFFTGLSFFTFSQYLGLIGSNIFLTVAISGIISIPGSIICLFNLAQFGRKTTLNVFQTIATACFVLLFFIPKKTTNIENIRLIFAGVGFAAIAGTIPALYLFSGELFPTVGRNVGVGGVTTFARGASMIAPIIIHLDILMPNLPVLLLIFISSAQIFLVLRLPETKNHPLPDTLEEAENFT